VFRAGVPHPSLIVRDLARGAGLRALEDKCQGPAFKKWRPIEGDRVVTQGSPSGNACQPVLAE